MTDKKRCDVVFISVENAFPPAFSMPSLEAYLSKNGIKAEILYPRVAGDSLQSLVGKVLELRPFVVGIGGLFNDRFTIKNIIEALNLYRNDFKIVVGGNLVTPIPEFMVNKLSADIAVIGEGEIIFTKLVKKILGNEAFSEIGGLAFKDGDNVISTGPGDYIENLDEVPPLNYEKIPMEHFVQVYKFYKNMARNNFYTPSIRAGPVLTGRGCPYRCNFCYHFNKLRLLTVPVVISQIKELKERFNINMIAFVDDLALINKKRTLELCRALMEERLDLKYVIQGHFNCLDEEMIVALKESGCIQLGLGLESGSQEVLNRINKGVKIEQIRSGLDLLRRYRINWYGGIQIGHLGETEEDVKKSRDLFYPYIDELSTVSFTITAPYPGTPLYYYGLNSGLIKSNEELFNKFKDLRTLLVNFSKLPDWRIRYLRLKLTFDFDLKKQQKVRGKWAAYLFLLKILIKKIGNVLSGRLLYRSF